VFAGLFSLAASLPFLTTIKARPGCYFFEAEMTATTPGMVQLFYDVGRGSNEGDSVHLPLLASAELRLYRFPLPTGTCSMLRLDPSDREGTFTIAHARVVDQAGGVVREFPPDDFVAYQQIATLAGENGHLKVVTTPGAFDPILTLKLARPLKLPLSVLLVVRLLAPVCGGIFAATLLIGAVFTAGPATAARRLVAWAEGHPVQALFATALVAVAVQCHPVLFFGRSFVSPNNAVFLLYDTFPTAPGYRDIDVEDARGSDVGAMMWAHLYAPQVQREALDQGEFPLWNRYDLCGVPLLGQGQLMFGDPFNWLTIAARGATWAWDARFLAMRVLFCFGIGLAVWLLARHLAAALLLTATIGFIGFFAFRLNHPAALSLCWSPWVLVAWCWLLEARTPRARNLSLLALFAAHGCMMTSGTIKEAYMLTLCLDLTGALLVLTAVETWRRRLGKLGAALVAGVVFLLVSAPQWMTFLDALKKSHTSYDVPAAAQLSPWLFIGFFEDLFYRQLRVDEPHYDPSSNFVVLFGLLWVLVNLREIGRQRRLAVVLGAALLPFGLVFGVIPSSWIVKVPFVANIIHIDNTFSCPLLVLTAVIAGFGLALAIRGWRDADWLPKYATFVLLLAGLAWLYFGSTQQIAKSPFFVGYIPGLFLAMLACPVGIRLAARRGQRGAVAAIGIGALALLLWRHGQYLSTSFDTYVVNPKIRVDVAATSPATRFVDARRQEPARTVGTGYILFPGYNQALDWESIYGVEALRNRDLDELATLTPMKKVFDWVGGPPVQDDIREALPMQDLLNVRYYLAPHLATPRELPGRRLLAALDLDVYESPTAWPRAFFTNALATYAAPADFVRLTLKEGARPFAAVQERDVPHLPAQAEFLSKNLATRTSVPASGYRLTANTTSFDVTASTPGVIVLSETYYPGDFQVEINDRPTTYFRVNHLFKGIYVDQPGIYHLTFRYWPEHFTLSLWLAAAGVVLALAAWLGDGYLRRRASPA
jgi:hypothetical protein